MFYILSIEGIPFITRFKTISKETDMFEYSLCIEGIPFITRFKTSNLFLSIKHRPPTVY